MESSIPIKGELKGIPKKLPRIRSIDLFRAIGILIMIVGHFGLWFLNGDELSWSWWDYVGMWFGPFGAPFFLICVGFSQVFFIENKKKSSSEKEARNAIFRRGAFIWGFGYLLNVLVEGFPRIFNWSILVLIGVSSIITFFTLKLSIRVRVLISCLLLVLNPLSQFIGTLYFYTTTGFLIWDPFILHDILHVSITIHDIWNPFSLNMVLIGTIFGSLTLNRIKKGEMKSLTKTFLLYGFFLCIFGALFDANLRVQGVMPLILDFEHEIHVIFSTGVFLLFFALFFWLLDIKKRKITILEHIITLSSLSFTVFVAHHLFARYFFGPIFVSTIGKFDLFDIHNTPIMETLVFNFLYRPGNLLTTFSLQIITIMFTIFFWIIAVFWSRFKLKYSLEWVIRKLS